MALSRRFPTDFINVTRIYSSSFNLNEAISFVPEINRWRGLVITFKHSLSDEWVTYLFLGETRALWADTGQWEPVLNEPALKGYYFNVYELNVLNPNPKIGDYAFVGPSIADSKVYIVNQYGQWEETNEKVNDYVHINSNLTIGPNGNWFYDGNDSGFKAQGEKGEAFKYEDFTWQQLQGLKGEDGVGLAIGAITAEMIPEGSQPYFDFNNTGVLDGFGRLIYQGHIGIPYGAQGVPGLTPVLLFGTITMLNENEPAIGNIHLVGYEPSGAPKYQLELSIPRGYTGQAGLDGLAGSGSGNVRIENAHTGVKNNRYLLSPNNNASLGFDIIPYSHNVLWSDINGRPLYLSQFINDIGLGSGGNNGGGNTGGVGISNITGLILSGTNVVITGQGTYASPYIINSTAQGSGGASGGEIISLVVDGSGNAVTNVTKVGSLLTIHKGKNFLETDDVRIHEHLNKDVLDLLTQQHIDFINLFTVNGSTVKLDDGKNFQAKVILTDTLTIIDQIKSQSYIDGVTGFKIAASGDSELRSLKLREFLEVPELRYNRIDVLVGDRWRAPGAGIIESVNTSLSRFTLKLEDGEIGSFKVDDICMGIFHDLTGNAAADYDDGIGNRRYAGFKTVYFKVVSVSGANNEIVNYSLRPVSGNYPTLSHPSQFMHCVAYGNFTNSERRSSVYQTRDYERYLANVSNWEYTTGNVVAQFGKLDNLSVFGLSLAGYSIYLDNVYLSGVTQLVKIPKAKIIGGLAFYISGLGATPSNFEINVVTENIDNPVYAWKKYDSGSGSWVAHNTFSGSSATINPSDGRSVFMVEVTGDDLATPVTDTIEILLLAENDGKMIDRVEAQYALTLTATPAPSSFPHSTAPARPKGQYLWERLRIIYTDTTSDFSPPRIVSGYDGQDGLNGYTPVKGLDYFDGTPGTNGLNAFVHIRYANNISNSSSTSITTNPAGQKYVGIASSNSPTAPTTVGGYNWSLIEGTLGIPGEIGPNGQTSYLHIKYSNDGGLTFTSSNGEDVGDWIGVYVDFIQADSNNVNSYTWNKVTGSDGMSYLVKKDTVSFHNNNYSKTSFDIEVYEGSTRLAYTSSASPNNGQYKVTVVPTGITIGAVTAITGGARIPNISGYNLTGTNSLAITITGKRSDGVSFTYTKTVVYERTADGAPGAPGTSGVSPVNVDIDPSVFMIKTTADRTAAIAILSVKAGNTSHIYDAGTTGTVSGRYKVTMSATSGLNGITLSATGNNCRINAPTAVPSAGGTLTLTISGANAGAPYVFERKIFYKKYADGTQGPAGTPGTAGASGNSVEMMFRNGANPPPSGFLASNTARTPANWSYTPTAPAANQYTYYITARISGNNALLGTWSAPIRIQGLPGNTGPQGLDGCVMRTTEYSDTALYCSDAHLSTPRSGETVRYVDIVKTPSDAFGNFTMHQCISTKTPRTYTLALIKLTTGNVDWVLFNINTTPVYTPLILADNAKINFFQGNLIIMTDANNQITAGISGRKESDWYYDYQFGISTSSTAFNGSWSENPSTYNVSNNQYLWHRVRKMTLPSGTGAWLTAEILTLATMSVQFSPNGTIWYDQFSLSRNDVYMRRVLAGVSSDYVRIKNENVGIQDLPAFWAGGSYMDALVNPTFVVRHDGSVVATNATITGKIESNGSGNRVTIDPITRSLMMYNNSNDVIVKLSNDLSIPRLVLGKVGVGASTAYLSSGDFILGTDDRRLLFSMTKMEHKAGTTKFVVEPTYNGILKVLMGNLPIGSIGLSSGYVFKDINNFLKIVP